MNNLEFLEFECHKRLHMQFKIKCIKESKRKNAGKYYWIIQSYDILFYKI